MANVNNYGVDTNILRLSWSDVMIYIDGALIGDSQMGIPIEYDIYLLEGYCDPNALSAVSEYSTLYKTTTASNIDVTVSPPEDVETNYCVYVIPKFYGTKGYMHGFARQFSVLIPAQPYDNPGDIPDI